MGLILRKHNEDTGTFARVGVFGLYDDDENYNDLCHKFGRPIHEAGPTNRAGRRPNIEGWSGGCSRTKITVV